MNLDLIIGVNLKFGMIIGEVRARVPASERIGPAYAAMMSMTSHRDRGFPPLATITGRGSTASAAASSLLIKYEKGCIESGQPSM